MNVTATARHIRISPRKVRVVIDTIRGKKVEEALHVLEFIKKGSALPVAKLVQSALANAENNFDLKKENLFIKTITADEGSTLRRFKPRAFGRASAIRKRSSHIHVVLDELKPSKAKKAAKKVEVEKPKLVKAEELKKEGPKESKVDTQQPGATPKNVDAKAQGKRYEAPRKTGA